MKEQIRQILIDEATWDGINIDSAVDKILSLLDGNREVVSDDSSSESSVSHDVRKWNATTANDEVSETSVESALGKRIDDGNKCRHNNITTSEEYGFTYLHCDDCNSYV